jgi:hypothetical protein
MVGDEMARDLLAFGKPNDGTLITEPGYHPATRLLYEPTQNFTLPPVAERPSPRQIAAARTLLLDDLLGDFPFVGEAERAHALALLLLPFVRPMIPGPTPLHMVEKPAPGTGATLMVDAISIVGTKVSPVHVVLCLIDLKLARLARDPKHLDSQVDVAGYTAVLREVSR